MRGAVPSRFAVGGFRSLVTLDALVPLSRKQGIAMAGVIGIENRR